MKARQKFRKGDLVRVADDLGPSMRHFYGAGKEAIVVGSYSDQYGGDLVVADEGVEDDDQEAPEDYSLLFEGHGQVSWYCEDQLTLIKRRQSALARKWIKAGGGNVQDEWVFA